MRHLKLIALFGSIVICTALQGADLDLNQELAELERASSSQKLAVPESPQDFAEQISEPSIFDIIDQSSFSKEIAYNPKEKRDIFVIPWVVSAVNATRMLVLAEGHLEKKQYSESERTLRNILAQYPGSEYSKMAGDKLKIIADIRKKQARLENFSKQEKERQKNELENLRLPKSVKKNISAVIWDSKHSVMTYRDELLEIGQKLPDNEKIKIHSFKKPYIYFTYKGKVIKTKFEAISN